MDEYTISMFSIDSHDRKDVCVKRIFIPKYYLWRNACLFNFIFSLQKWAECLYRCRFRRGHILGPRSRSMQQLSIFKMYIHFASVSHRS